MKKLPKKSKTLTNKLRRTNPWGIGKDLADVIDENWDSLVANWPSENHVWLGDFCKVHKLSSSWVFRGAILNYL